MKQAEADLAHAVDSLPLGHFEWICFACHQAAEKSLKSLYNYLGREVWGHSLTILGGRLEKEAPAIMEKMDCLRVLDKHYIPTRYPNGFSEGAPVDYYTRAEAEQAVECAREVVNFVKNYFERPPKN